MVWMLDADERGGAIAPPLSRHCVFAASMTLAMMQISENLLFSNHNPRLSKILTDLFFSL